MKEKDTKLAKCSICGIEMSKFFGKHPLGICNTCKRVFCPNCVKALKKDKCPQCGNKIFKRKGKMKEYPEEWSTGEHINNPNPGMIPVLVKEIIREIVKIPCPYCKMLVENTVSVCPGCHKNLR